MFVARALIHYLKGRAFYTYWGWFAKRFEAGVLLIWLVRKRSLHYYARLPKQ